MSEKKKKPKGLVFGSVSGFLKALGKEIDVDKIMKKACKKAAKKILAKPIYDHLGYTIEEREQFKKDWGAYPTIPKDSPSFPIFFEKFEVGGPLPYPWPTVSDPINCKCQAPKIPLDHEHVRSILAGRLTEVMYSRGIYHFDLDDELIGKPLDAGAQALLDGRAVNIQVVQVKEVEGELAVTVQVQALPKPK